MDDAVPADVGTVTTSLATSPELGAVRRASPPPPPTAAPHSQHKVQCWGHRGASAHLPENTLASYRAAILEGAEGIESGASARGEMRGRGPEVLMP